MGDDGKKEGKNLARKNNLSLNQGMVKRKCFFQEHMLGIFPVTTKCGTEKGRRQFHDEMRYEKTLKISKNERRENEDESMTSTTV